MKLLIDKATIVTMDKDRRIIKNGAVGANVDTVIVDGRVIMEKGEIRTVDEKQIMAKAQEAGAKILERTGLGRKLKPRWPVV